MITLGLVANVDTSGVYVTMPGARGVLRGPYETLQNVAVGDRVLVVTTDDGENVIVGQAAATSPRSVPATSTDNAVPRFDGTGGALQNSGVTITDGNGIQVGAATDPMMFRSTASMDVFIDAGTSGRNAAVFLRTGGNKRWFVGKESSGETGSDAGSNFRIWRYHDDGSSIGQAFGINRATGKVTIDSTGPTAGLEFGASGPTITTGTGAPSHSAPNGSVYLRTDGTATTTLYVRAGGAWTALS